MGPTFSFQYGRKNRLIVFKTTRPNNGGPGGYLSVQGVGFYTNGTGFTSLNLDEPRMFNNAQSTFVQYQAHSVSEDKTATKTTARLSEFTSIAEHPTLQNKPGATVKFGGEVHTLVSIKKGVTAQVFLGDPEEQKQPKWTLTLRSTHNSPHPLSLSLVALDATGQPIAHVDDKGNPVSEEEYRKQMTEYQRKMETNYRQGIRAQVTFPRFVPVIAYASSRDGSLSVILRVNPAKVAQFALNGGITRYIDITDIPLGP